MNDLDDLDPDALKLALECVETVLKFRAVTSGKLFVMLLGKLRDDLCNALSMEPLRRLVRGAESNTFAALNSAEVDSLIGAVMILRQPRFTRAMDDPELIRGLGEFEAELNAHKEKQAASKARLNAQAM